MFGKTPSVGGPVSYRGQSTGSLAGGTGIWRGTLVLLARNGLKDPDERHLVSCQADLIPPRPPSWSLKSQTDGRAGPSRRWPGAERDRPTSWRYEQGAWGREHTVQRSGWIHFQTSLSMISLENTILFLTVCFSFTVKEEVIILLGREKEDIYWSP